MTFFFFCLYITYRPSRTYVPTIGTEQYRGDHWGFLRWAACEGSQQAFTQTIYSRRLSVRWIYSKASRRLAWESSGLSSEPQILQRTAGATAGRTLTWEVSMTTDSPKDRPFFREGGLNATTIENETLKKRRVTLWHKRVLFLVQHSLERWIFLCLCLTPFFQVCFQVCGAHLTDTETRVDGALSHIPGVADPAGHVQFCCDWLAFGCLSAALQCFQLRLQPASESRASSGSSKTQRPRRRRFEEKNLGGSKLGSSTVSERVCSEESELLILQ